ncbi:MAG: transketolase family protein [Clostridiales Family XIII bacterium]|jgi:transketolase|nr:transketolase family protein [Clostridiales Family XIII bacterium]
MSIIYDGTLDKDQYKGVFGEAIEALAAEDKDVIYLDCDLMNSFGTYKFWQGNKNQAFNIGISEANAVGIAAGLSAAGKKPYVHTFGPFASRRCYDQAFLSVGYTKNSVRIFGSDAGVTAAFNGGTHMPFEDMALYRAVPEATVLEVTDAAMFRALIKLTKDRPGLNYIRTTRKNYPTVYSADHAFEIGKAETLTEGNDVAIFAIGLMVGEALKAAATLKEKGINARVIDAFTIKPLDLETLKKAAEETKAIVTTENHNIIGGLGDAVLGGLSELGIAAKVKKHGVQDRFGSVGDQKYLQEFYGLTAEKIVETVEAVLA